MAGALSRVPGLGGFLEAGQLGQQEQLGQLQQLGAVQGILGRAQQQKQQAAALQREEQLRGVLSQLPQDATPEMVTRAITPYAAPDVLLRTFQSSADRAAQRENTAAMAAAAQAERRAALEARLADARTSREEQANLRRELAEMNNQARADMLRLTAQLRPAPQPRAEPGPAMTEIVDPKDPTKLLRIDARTFNRDRYLQGNNLGVIGVSGKEPGAAKKADQVDAGRETVSTLTTQLKDYYDRLNEGGGIVNQDSGLLSNLTARAASTALGQTAGQFTGTKNQMIRDSIEQQRPALLNAIKQATGMSAKQMDSNAELKLYLATATDPTKGYQANLDALKMIDKLYGTAGASSAAPTPAAMSPEDKQALDWANANLNDPRAAAIKQRLRVR